MTEKIQAWIERGMERSLLLEGLMQQTYTEERARRDPVFLFRLASTLLVYLQQRHHNAACYDTPAKEDFFFATIFPKIQEFGKSQAEEDALVAEFWEMVVATAVVSFSDKLQKEEEVFSEE